MGQRQELIAALVRLEETVDPAMLTVHPLRPSPSALNPPAIYNWFIPTSPPVVIGGGIVEDVLRIAVRIVTATGDIDAEMENALELADLLADTIDVDIIKPSGSILRSIGYHVERVSERPFADTFDSIPYLTWEFVLQVTLRKTFSPN